MSHYAMVCDCAIGLFDEFPGYEEEPCESCEGVVETVKYSGGSLRGLVPMVWGKDSDA